ncbi:MAG TPA: aminotransferase class I/II-fold pyridoxal phosphate-dependent enzyme [Saprospiraceae bacterium]|nr:aminotransferase class I/II-fold pyridoxal phosphate-dependent enzyme [Saprospiraceae bacterium]
MDLSYILNELGEEREHYFNAIAPPIIQTSNFKFNTVDEMRQRFKDEYGGYIYSRGLNPTVDILRKKLAALDEAEDALVFNSGASAIFSSVVPFVSSGDHIISVRNPYTWAQRLFNDFLPRFGVQTSYVEGRLLSDFENAIQENTKLIYLESPNSWDFGLQDIAAISKFAKTRNCLVVIDNSYCSPYYQKPILLGADLVLQSATKYLAGHSDVVCGVLTGRKELLQKIFNLEYLTAGNGIQPFNAWLLMRGLRTLPARMDRIAKTTQVVLEYLKQHPKIESVIFPLDANFPQVELARKQMQGACGLLSFVVKTTDPKNIEHFSESLKHIMMAVSWGGYESLIIPRIAGMELKDFNPSDPMQRLIRLYVGLEDADYIIADLEQALKSITN